MTPWDALWLFVVVALAIVYLLGIVFLIVSLKSFLPRRGLPAPPATHRLRLRLPREGGLWLLLAGSLFLIGWARNINLVLPIAYFLLLLFAWNTLLAWPGLRVLQAVRRFPDLIFAETPFTLGVEVSNPARRRRIGLRIEDHGPDRAAPWFLLRLGGGETAPLTVMLTLPSRGRYRWGELVAASGYPFGLVRWETTLVAAENVLVLPRLGRLHRGRLRRFLTLDTPREERLRPSGRASRTAQSEIHGLRPMRSGDSPRWIHWRTSARRGELMVREFEYLLGDDLVLIVYPPKDRLLLEDVVSLAATICWEWCRQRGDRLSLVLLGPTPVHWKGTTGPDLAGQMLEGLAELEMRATEIADLKDHLHCSICNPKSPWPGSVLVIGTGRELRDAVAEHLRRPVAWIDGGRLDTYDFYERPAVCVSTPPSA